MTIVKNDEIKPKTKKPSSVSNAQKAREAKLEKMKQRKEVEKKIAEIPKPLSDDSDDEELVYVPVKQSKSKQMKEQPVKNDNELLRKELEELKKLITVQNTPKIELPPPPPPKQNTELLSHVRNKILNF